LFPTFTPSLAECAEKIAIISHDAYLSVTQKFIIGLTSQAFLMNVTIMFWFLRPSMRDAIGGALQHLVRHLNRNRPVTCHRRAGPVRPTENLPSSRRPRSAEHRCRRASHHALLLNRESAKGESQAGGVCLICGIIWRLGRVGVQ